MGTQWPKQSSLDTRFTDYDERGFVTRTTTHPISTSVPWQTYKLRPPVNWQTWPSHIKAPPGLNKVPLLHYDAIRRDMAAAELAALDYYEFYFTEEFLRLVPRGGPTRVDMERQDITDCKNAGMFERPHPDDNPDDMSESLEAHYFFAPLVDKQTKRLITHTVAINQATDKPEPNHDLFTTQEQRTLDGTQGVGFTGDAMTFYQQFTIPYHLRKYHRFWSDEHGVLQLTVIATGQRHCVGEAQLTSKFIQRKTTEHLHASAEFLALPKPQTQLASKDSYIDNFRRMEASPQHAICSVHSFLHICRIYNVTLNESEAELLRTIGQPHDYIGVHYAGNTVDLTEKTRRKLRQASADTEFISRWTFGHAESIFGLLIFASSVKRFATPGLYYTYKFFRRRHSQRTDQKDTARVWPCIHEELINWIQTLIDSTPIQIHTDPDEKIAVLVTDASPEGHGAVYFAANGRVYTSGGAWPQHILDAHLPIMELETMSHLYGLQTHHSCDGAPSKAPVHSILDNTTTLYSIKKSRCKNFFVNQLLIDICQWNIRSLEYLKSEDMIADGLSRGKAFDPALLADFEYTLHKQPAYANYVVTHCQRPANTAQDSSPLDWKRKAQKCNQANRLFSNTASEEPFHPLEFV